jgi:hypothetical protein
VDNDLIEQIVANVLAELQPAPHDSAPKSTTPISPRMSEVIELDLPVITAEVLSDAVRQGQAVRIGRRSILTPSARDWLGSRKLGYSRMNGSSVHATSARWQIVMTTVTQAVAALRPVLAGCRTELLGTAREAAEFATRAICSGEADGVFGLCGSAEAVACLANRNAKVRAATWNSPAELNGLMATLGPNLLVMNPQRKSFVELRNAIRAVQQLGRPQIPAGW